MKGKFKLLAATTLVAMLVVGITGVALAFDSGGNPGTTGPNTITWTGQGTTDGALTTVECDESNTPYLLWILTTDGGSAHDATLHLGGSGSGDYAGTAFGNEFHFYTPYFTPDSSLTAYADFVVDDPGNGSWNLVISHGCPGKLTPDVVTEIHLDDESVVTGAVPLGSVVHDQATVSGSGPTPAGWVQFFFFPNGTCEGDVELDFDLLDAGLVALDGSGTAHPSDSEGPLEAGDYSFKAFYLGDDNYNPAWSDCEPLHVNQESTTTTTEVHDPDHNVVTGVIPGVMVHDKAIVTAANQPFTITGDVTYYLFLNGDCSGAPYSTETVPVGTESSPWLPPALGWYSYQASYSGDDNYLPSIGACEPFSVFIAPLTPGYWKTHLAHSGTAGCADLPSGTGCSRNGPFTKDYLPQYLGTYSVDTIRKAAKVFVAMNCSNTGTNTEKNQNAIGCLAGHLLAAELNVANGADSCIQPVIDMSNTFLTNPPLSTVTFAGHSASSIHYIGPTGDYTWIGSARRSLAITLKSALGRYNNGLGCP
jgi:hypothetical protein